MSKQWFSTDKVKALSELEKGARVHIIGICGVAMGQLALELSRQGFKVSGSDHEFYDPMGPILKTAELELFTGYSGDNLNRLLDLVVIGNSVSYSNPEVQAVENLGLNYSLFPKLLYDLGIAGRHSIVFSGTHGKSTSTALAACALTDLNQAPSYFVGAAVQQLPSSLQVGSGAISVVEGDEYDSCFFAKVPKFSFYQPNTWVITSLEFDHADIYPDLSSIERAFESTLSTLKRSDTVLVGIDCENLRRLLPRWKKSFAANFITYGQHDSADVVLSTIEQQGFLQHISVLHKDSKIAGLESNFKFSISLPGAYNARNALAVLLSLSLNKLALPEILQALSSFRGLRRRQELRYHGDVTLIEDFAHHPTAVRETLNGIRQAFPQGNIIAVFEPKSTTSRRKMFEQQYVQSFNDADQVILCQVQARASDSKADLLDVRNLAQQIHSAGKPCQALANPQEIFTYLCSNATTKDAVIVVMSNGSFGGLAQLLEDYLRNAIIA